MISEIKGIFMEMLTLRKVQLSLTSNSEVVFQQKNAALRKMDDIKRQKDPSLYVAFYMPLGIQKCLKSNEVFFEVWLSLL